MIVWFWLDGNVALTDKALLDLGQGSNASLGHVVPEAQPTGCVLQQFDT